MDLQHIGQSDWAYFEREHHAAFNFLLRASLLGEWEYLKGCSSLSKYQKQRLLELNNLLNLEK